MAKADTPKTEKGMTVEQATKVAEEKARREPRSARPPCS